MPTYDYECENGHRFEAFQSMKDALLTACTECGGSVKRVIGPGAGFIFKGGGFYITDYRSKEYKDKAKAETGSKGDAGGGGSDAGGKSGGGSDAGSKSGGGSDAGGKSGGGSSTGGSSTGGSTSSGGGSSGSSSGSSGAGGSSSGGSSGKGGDKSGGKSDR